MEDESWLCYVWWSNVLIIKMMIFTWCTGRLRVSRKVIHSEADRMFIKEPGVILDPTGGGHPDIDRIRAAHRSDVETVLPFLLMGLIWLETSPSVDLVKLVIRSFSLARIFHGLFYMDVIPVHQLVKVFTSLFSYLVAAYIALSCLVHYA
ncbi:microsomal glutathione S-transferase 1-like [Neodiprion fabricii]|uniref:microsomal glutathione S-transferase 1-like n=1 Tax=Neodiprion fabricii TaxID=2872261 RepID=UPI001ED91D70|nr:microsomal glutathione S-transferase 1-like [Neodiprion fabricii]